MSTDDAMHDGTTIEGAWRAKAIAEQIMDEYSEPIDSHEGVLLALQLAYLEGANDGLNARGAALRTKLAAL